MAARAPYVEDPDGDDIRRIIGTAQHEWSANYNFNEFGLMPWFACDSAVKGADGAVKTTVELDALGGDEATVKLYNQDSGLVLPKDGETRAGTEIAHEKIREFRIRVEATDEVGERKANFHLRPRWANLKAEKNGQRVRVPVPQSLANSETDAVSIAARGSNIENGRYPALLREAAEAVGISDHYFADPHSTSNQQDSERYVRIDRDAGGPIHARDGPIAALGHLLEGDRSGYRKLVQDDTKIEGHYHTVTLGPDRIREAFPNHSAPKEIKFYFPREPNGRDEDDPLHHPKLGVSYQANRWDRSLGVDQEDIDRINREIDETIFAVLVEAGLDLRAGGDTFVEDAYFGAENTTTDANIVALDLTRIKHEQEAVVYQQLAGGMSPVEQETLQTLVTDGGSVSPRDIAETTGRHQDSVYDALGRLQGLVDHTYGNVELRSTYLSKLVSEALKAAEDAVARATHAAGEAERAVERGLDENTAKFAAWKATYGLNHIREDDAIRLDAGDVSSFDEVKDIVEEGYELWREMGRAESDYRMGRVRYSVPDGTAETTYLDSRNRRGGSSKIWHLL